MVELSGFIEAGKAQEANIFVISVQQLQFEMSQPSQDSLDEDRILCELKGLDSRLNCKSSAQLDSRPLPKYQQQYNSFGKYPQLAECNRSFLNQINNLEYFSEINNKDMEEDSLFPPEIGFLAQPALKQYPNASKMPAKFANPANAFEKRQMNKSVTLKSSQANSSKDAKTEQILREQEYIFRKEKNEDQRKPLPSTTHSKTTTIKSSSKATPKQSEPNTKKQSQKYDHNLHNYLFEERDAKDIQKDDHAFHLRMKTEQPNQSSIESYLEQLASSQVGQRALFDSRGKSRVREKQIDECSLECTFKPKILKKSKELAKSSKNVIERLSTNNTQKSIKLPYQPNKPNPQKPKMQRIEELSQPRRLKTMDLEEEELPSFKPSLSKKSLQHMSNCTYDVATRNKLWLEQKEQKIVQMRKQQEEEKLRKEECTYSPAIKAYKGEQDVQFSRFGKQGMVQYFQRLSLMKKKNSVTNLKKDDTLVMKDYTEELSQNNKQNTNQNISRQRSFTNLYKSKKQTYEQAVKNLHSKIMKLKI